MARVICVLLEIKGARGIRKSAISRVSVIWVSVKDV